MSKRKNTLAIALFLILAATLFSASLTTTKAAIVQVDTFLFLMITPNPAGVGQQLLITVQLDKVAPNALFVTGGTHFTGFMLEITRPDGTTETRGPDTAYAPSSYFVTYTPTQTGIYKFQASFPGQWDNTSSSYTPFPTTPYSPNTDYYFKPDESEIVEVTVQDEPVPPYPSNIIPKTEYWQRPINAENKDWWLGADNWLMEGYDYDGRRFPSYGAVSPYSAAPDSAHILWRKPMWFGGIAGGQFGDKSYYTGLSYEQPYLPLILEGRIIYSEHAPTTSTFKYGTRCLDLYTGEEIWYLEGITINFAQVYAIETPNEHGLIAHLWSISGPGSNQTWKMYDGFSGNFQMTLTNVTAGITTIGPNGEMLSYSISGSMPNRRLIMWNSSAPLHRASTGLYGEYYSPVPGSVANGNYGIQYNVSMPNVPGIIKYVSLEENKIVTINFDTTAYPFPVTFAAYNAETGNHLWTKEIKNVYGMYAPNRLPYSPTAIRDGIMVVYDDSKRQLHGYDLDSGVEIWVTDPMPEGWAYFNQVIEIAYGKVFNAGYDGHVRAYNAETGDLEWDYYLGSAGTETHYDSWPIYAGFTVADGKIFFTNDDHSPDSVLWRGGKLYALDVETGENVWNVSGWFRIPAVSDGYLTAENSLDGEIYVFGKGPTATTVSLQNDVVTHGNMVLIKGTVMDVSAGTMDNDVASRFPNGVAAVSEGSMSAWMEYVYMQKAFPQDSTGVQVTIDVLDANGNYRTIGSATTEASGTFGLTWEPDIPGLYTVIATFSGSSSYGSSYAVTYLNVVEAPPAPLEPTPQPASAADLYFLPMSIVTIVAIIVIGIVLILMLRKR